VNSVAHLVQPAITLGFYHDGVDDYQDLPLAVFNQDRGSWGGWIYGNFSALPVAKVRIFNSEHSLGYNYEFRTYGNFSWIFANGTVYTSVYIGALVDNEWNQVFFTWEYRLATDDTLVKGYKNGVYIAEGTISGKISVPDQYIRLGFWGGSYFEGIIGELLVFNRVLSNTEISDIHSIRRNIMDGCVLKLGTVGLVRGGGTQWLDESPYKNHGTVYGAKRVRCCHCNVVRDYGT